MDGPVSSGEGKSRSAMVEPGRAAISASGPTSMARMGHAATHTGVTSPTHRLHFRARRPRAEMQSVRGRGNAGVRGGVSHARHRGGPAGGNRGAAGLDHRAAGLALAGTDRTIHPLSGAQRGPGMKEWPLILFTL